MLSLLQNGPSTPWAPTRVFLRSLLTKFSLPSQSPVSQPNGSAGYFRLGIACGSRAAGYGILEHSEYANRVGFAGWLELDGR